MKFEEKQMDMIMESLLFLAGAPLEIPDVVSKLQVEKDEVLNSLDRLKYKYSQEDCGINLLTFNNKAQFSSNSKLADVVATVLNPIREKRLSQAAMETLSIIAYKQPITKTEIEEIRGVSCDYAVNVLLSHKLVEPIGRRDAIGKPLVYGTTDEFLKRFNLDSLSSLPDEEIVASKCEIIKSESSDVVDIYHRDVFDEKEEAIKQATIDDMIAHADDDIKSQFGDGEMYIQIDSAVDSKIESFEEYSRAVNAAITQEDNVN